MLNDEITIYLKSPVTPLKLNLLETWEISKIPGLSRQCYWHTIIAIIVSTSRKIVCRLQYTEDKST